MVEAKVQHRLAAIMAADVAGYSRLMEGDEQATVAALDTNRLIFRQHVDANQGRIVDTAGDSVLAIFETATGALRAAIAIQAALAEENKDVDADRRMDFRIGINLGEVIEKPDGSIYGGGVNVAARLESLAEPGGVTVSGSVFEQVKSRIDAGFDFVGEQRVKNIAEKVPAYGVWPDGAAGKVRRRAGVGKQQPALIIAALAVLVLAVGGAWIAYEPTSTNGNATPDELLSLPSGPAIAVLPFENLGGDPEQDFFADGLAGDILGELSLIPEMKVIGRASTLKYKNQAVDIPTVGRELGVDFVVEGTVRRAASTLRVTAELLNAADGAQLWANTYDRQLDAENVFAVLDEITTQVVTTIADGYGVIPTLTRKRGNSRDEVALSSYECVLLGYEYFETLHSDDHLRARDCLEAAVEDDPEYADAWGWLAIIYSHEHALFYNTRPDPHKRALAAGRAGVAANPKSRLAWEGLAAAHYFRQEIDEFLPAAERAIELNPNDASTIANMGYYMAATGRYDRGLSFVKKAMSLSPYHPKWYYLGFFYKYYQDEDYKTALDYMRKMHLPGLFWSHGHYAAVSARLGNMETAREQAALTLKAWPEYPEKVWSIFRSVSYPEKLAVGLVEVCGRRASTFRMKPKR